MRLSEDRPIAVGDEDSKGQRRRRFMVVDHGADVGLLVYGSTEEEVYRNAAAGLFSMIVTAPGPDHLEERWVTVQGDEYLLIAFLNELLFLWDTERFVVRSVTVRLDRGSMRAKLQGERFREGHHRMKREIKAVTYHGYEMKHWRSRLRAKLVIDV